MTPFAVVLFSITVFTACGEDTPSAANDEPTVVEVAQSSSDFETLVSALQDADLVSALNGEGPFTVFAPTDNGFASLPDGLLESLTKEQLTEILSYHVVSGEIASGDLQAEQSVEALTGGQLFVTAGNEVAVNGQATVVSADIEASNGIIHAIDKVLLPDDYLSVVGVVTKRYNLQTVEEAVVQADLAGTLSDQESSFTVFAPVNAAFEGIDTSGLSQQELQDILTYHVLDTEVLSSDISSGTVTTVNGETLDIQVANDGSVSLTDQAGNTYNVISVDLQGNNGVVHIIDGVLMPN